MLCRSGIVYTVPVQIQNKSIKAVLDTGAEVTVMSDKLLKQIVPQPATIKNITLKSAGRGMKMEGKLVGPIDIKIGSNTYQDNIYVAPIEDDMLLGLQFLKKIGASAHLGSEAYYILFILYCDATTYLSVTIQLKFGFLSHTLQILNNTLIITCIFDSPELFRCTYVSIINLFKVSKVNQAYIDVLYQRLTNDVSMVKWSDHSPLKLGDFTARVRISLEVVILTLFKLLFARCVPMLRVSILYKTSSIYL